jgi:hypothetical protein
MSKQQIIIGVPANPAEGVTVEVNGIKGPGCKKLTEGLESALGKIQSDQLTPEFEMRPSTQEDSLTQ